MTYREARVKAAGMLKEAGVEFEANESWLLLAYITGLTKARYLMVDMDQMNGDEEQAYFEVVKKRCTRYPLQYITGEQYFMGLPFRVTPDVLIPRQDTEVLVEHGLRILKEQYSDRDEVHILDMCTGSGCIAVSLGYHFPNAIVTGADISAAALKVAQENSRMNGVPVRFLESDLFLNISDKYDMIVSNPPYIASSEIKTLMPEVKDHEPMGALDGLEDGLYFYKKIVKESSNYLKEGGWLLFEIGYDQGQAVAGLMEEAFADVQVIADLAGLDRVVIGRRMEHV